MPSLLALPLRAAALRRFLPLAGLLAATPLLALEETNPLLGSWHFTGFENEVNSSPKPKFFFGPLPFKTVEISEPVAGTLRLVLKRANGTVFETVERPFTREGDRFENSHVEPDTDGRERALLGFRVIREDLVLAQEIGAWFADDDTQLWDAWGFAGVLTKAPLPKTNTALWAGPYAGTEWIHKTDYSDESGTHFFSTETGALTFTLDKTGSGYRFTADYATDEETDTGTAKSSGSYLAVDWQESGGTIWETEHALGTLLNSRGYNRVVQISDRELVILGVSGDVSRISPKPGVGDFQAYNAIDYADSNLIYLQSTATFVREGQAVSLAAPDTEISGPFKAKGLPSGLVIDPATGALSGLANVKPGNYAITRSATGFTDIVYLRVESFPAALLANPDSSAKLVYSEFEALLRDPITAAPVGKVELKLAAGGLFTGKLHTAVPAPAILKDRFSPDAEGNAAAVTLALSGERTLHLSLSAESGLTATLRQGDTTLGLAEAGEYSGRIRLHSATSPAPGAPAKGSTPYTLALSLAEPSETAPAGHGWATAGLNTAGQLALKGKLADGRVLTASLRATSAGYLPYIKPYGSASAGYLAGRLRVSSREGGGHHVAASDGSLVWSKPAAVNSADRIPVFGPTALVALLEPWTKIVTAEDFASRLGLEGSTLAVTLDGGFAATEPARSLPDSLTFTVSKGKFASTVAAPVLDATSAAANNKAWKPLWSLTVNLADGTFTGSFTLRDTVPAATPKNPAATKIVTRNIPVSGVLLAGSVTSNFALGQYVVPSLEKTGATIGGAIELGALDL